MESLKISNESPITASQRIFQSLYVESSQNYSQNSSQIDQDKCYKMQIQQLRRQNRFLKKKLAQFTKKQQLSMPASTNTKQLNNLGNNPRQTVEDSQNYILSFIGEVGRLLQNVDLKQNLMKQCQQQSKLLNKLTKQTTEELYRPLGRLLIEPDQNKYKVLLQIFEKFYRQTVQNKKNLREKVERMISQAIEIGNKLVATIKQRQKVNDSAKRNHTIHVTIQPELKKEDFSQYFKPNIIKSTETGSNYQLSSVRMALGKQRLFSNLF